MGRLGSGRYTFRFRVDYRDTPYSTMADSGTIGDVVVTYEDLEALADPSTEASIALGAFSEVKRTVSAEVRDDATVVSATIIIVNNYRTGLHSHVPDGVDRAAAARREELLASAHSDVPADRPQACE